MADPQSAAPARQDAANEGRLRAARRGGDGIIGRLGRAAAFAGALGSSQPAEAAQPGPSMSDQAAEYTKGLRSERMSDQAAQQNIERRQGITQTSGVQIDRKRIQYTPESRVGDMTISRGQQVTEREEMGAGAKDRNVGAAVRQQRLEAQLNRVRRSSPAGGAAGAARAGGGAAANRGAAALAKKNPYVLAATTAVGAMSGSVDTKQISQTVGRGCARSMWSSLWPTFGHTVYVLFLIFFLSAHSRFARRFLPQVGEEWIPPEMLSKIPKALLIPLKLAEIVAIAFVLFWVLMLDLACIGLWALMLAVIMSAVNFVS